MARTLIWNTSATAQTLPAAYGSETIQPGYGWIVADESSVAVAALGGFADMDGKWAVAAISTDEALGSVDMNAAGVALIADVVSTIGGGGGGGGGGPVSWASVTGKPTFALVATSGSYDDLSDKPALATVATSGLYSDLSGTPSLPVASNVMATEVGSTGSAGVLNTYARGDHQHAHGNRGGGSLHSAATTAAAGFMSAADKTKLDGLASVATSGAYSDLSGAPALAAVATSGSYNDLSDKPSQFSGSYNDLTNKPTLFSGDYGDLTNKPSLATVATSGAYADLSGKPALFSGAYADLSGKPSLFDGDYNSLANKPDFSPYLTTVATANINDGAVTSAKITSVAASKVTGLAAVATSGSATDLANQPYDLMVSSPGSLTVGQVLMRGLAPRALVFTQLQQGGEAVVQIKINGVAASYPQSVSAGALITAEVTTAGVDNYFTVTGKVA